MDGLSTKARETDFQPEINEEPQRFSEAGQNKSSGVSGEGGNSTSISSATKGKLSEVEHEQMWKLKNFTRSEVKHATTIENLPGELLLNVFIRLLAKQLAQMRSVSKSWNNLLSHPSFVKSHLHRSINNNNRLLLVFYENASSYGPELYTAHPSRLPHPELTNFIKLPPVNPKSRQSHTTSTIEVIGFIHGLICSSYDDSVIHIWNPSLSAVSTVPPHSIPSIPSGSWYTISFRFGYDPKTDYYNIVKLIGITGTPPVVVKWLQVEVYSMRNGSWRFITQRFPSHVTRILKHDGICVDGHDGHLHWTGCIGEEGERQTVVAFDLGSETFCEISLPDSILGSRQSPNVIGVWDGKPCVFAAVVTSGVCEVWVMDEYGVPESWVKRHVFSKFVGHVHILGFTSHNEFLIVDGFSRLVLYNPTEHKAKTLENFCHDVYSVDKVVEYVDSLVWVAPTEREMVDDAGQS